MSERVTVRGMTAEVPDECIICGDFRFLKWMLKHGECKCKCGTMYQIRPLSSQDWDDVPYHKIKEEYIEELREYYEENGSIEEFEA